MADKNKKKLDVVAHEIAFSPKHRRDIYVSMSSHEQSRLILLLSRKVQKDLVQKLEDDEIVAVLEHLDPVDATSIIQLLPTKRGGRIVKMLSEILRGSVERLLQFDPKTAAGVMSVEYIQVDAEDKIEKVALKFKSYEEKTGRLPVVIVMREGKIAGYLPTHQFGFSKPSEKVEKYVKRIPKIHYGKSKREVLQVFRKNRHDKVVVIGEDNNVVGIIYSEDIIRLLREESASSLYTFAGVRDEEEVGDSAMTKVGFRYRWLIINLGTAFVAAFTVGLFEETISKFVLLAVYMPIVAGMGGNAGTQTMAVLVRGISMRQIRLRTVWPVLKGELGAALVNGLITGVLVALVVIALNRDYMIATILAMAMVINLVVAAFFGTLVPLVMKRLGKDPASSATIFITTATDVLGFLAFLGLATLLLL